MKETIAVVPKGAAFNGHQLNSLVDAYFKRGCRAFEKDEVEEFLRTGLLDCTDWSKIELSIGCVADDAEWDDDETIYVEFKPEPKH